MTYSLDDAKADLDAISPEADLFDRMMCVSGIVTKMMAQHVKESDMPIIVGGFSLEIYTESEYTTHDIDFVTSASHLMKEKLRDIGFEDNARIFQHQRLNVAIDIVDDTLEPPHYEGVIRLEFGDDNYVLVQSIEGILYDRVLDYDRRDNREYGIYLIAARYDDIDFEYLKDRLKVADPEALAALEEWVEVARGE
ncbi:hypothetical protein [Salinicoccus luteus]|uniref:hypothetical protein n=1 Tax=Salinicoccus luteus TaxID=367840 RepID=UPI0004E21F3B|nr:hypothetical protein [Salinicoccus luteus]